jgi:hypothetical protein
MNKLANVERLLNNATEYTKNILKIEEYALQERTNFLTWLVGLGSGAFLILMTRLTDVPVNALFLCFTTKNSAFWSLISFVSLLISSISFRLTIRNQLTGIHLDYFMQDYQKNILLRDLKKFARDTSSLTFMEINERFIFKLFLPKEEINNYVNGVKPYRRVAKLSTCFYVFALFAFISENIFLFMSLALKHFI